MQLGAEYKTSTETQAASLHQVQLLVLQACFEVMRLTRRQLAEALVGCLGVGIAVHGLEGGVKGQRRLARALGQVGPAQWWHGRALTLQQLLHAGAVLDLLSQLAVGPEGQGAAQAQITVPGPAACAVGLLAC